MILLYPHETDFLGILKKNQSSLTDSTHTNQCAFSRNRFVILMITDCVRTVSPAIVPEGARDFAVEKRERRAVVLHNKAMKVVVLRNTCVFWERAAAAQHLQLLTKMTRDTQMVEQTPPRQISVFACDIWHGSALTNVQVDVFLLARSAWKSTRLSPDSQTAQSDP